MNNFIGTLKCSGPCCTDKICCLFIINILWLIRNARETAQDAAMKFLELERIWIWKYKLESSQKNPQPNHPCIPVMGDKGGSGNCFSRIMDNLGTWLWTWELEAALSWPWGRSCLELGFLGLPEPLGSQQSSCEGEGSRWWDFQIHASAVWESWGSWQSWLWIRNLFLCTAEILHLETGKPEAN